MKYKDLKTGMDIVCEIDGDKVVGKIKIDIDGGVFINGQGKTWWWLDKDQDPCERAGVTGFYFNRTLHDLVEGDILVNEDGDECEVLGVCGRAIFLSVNHDLNEYADGYTAEQLEKDGWKLKDQPTEETIEIEGGKYTVAELKKLLKE